MISIIEEQKRLWRDTNTASLVKVLIDKYSKEVVRYQERLYNALQYLYGMKKDIYLTSINYYCWSTCKFESTATGIIE